MLCQKYNVEIAQFGSACQRSAHCRYCCFCTVSDHRYKITHTRKVTWLSASASLMPLSQCNQLCATSQWRALVSCICQDWELQSPSQSLSLTTHKVVNVRWWLSGARSMPSHTNSSTHANIPFCLLFRLQEADDRCRRSQARQAAQDGELH